LNTLSIIYKSPEIVSKNKFRIALVILLAGVFSLFMNSCDDKDDHPMPEITVSIESLQEHQTIEFGDSVQIVGTISSNEELHGYHIDLINKTASDSVVFSKENHDHASSYTIEEYWENNVSSHSDMLLKITVTADHDNGDKVHEIHFHCHPM
jgi:hypothetical protein